MKPTIIAVVGAHPAMSEMSRGILRRCGFIAIEAPSLDKARDLVHHGPPPVFIVAMVRGLARGAASESDGPLPALLSAVCSMVKPDHIIAVTAKGLWNDEVRQCETLGMHVVPEHAFSFRALARLLIDLQGGDGARCCPAAGERDSRQSGPAPAREA